MAVNVMDKTTEAFIGASAVVDARGDSPSMAVLNGGQAVSGLAVQASSSEDIFIIAANVGAGLYAGVAGGVDVNSSTPTPARRSTPGRTATYQPLANQTYVWVTGQKVQEVETVIYRSSSWFGIDWLSKDPDDIYQRSVYYEDVIPLSEGSYLLMDPNVYPGPSDGEYKYTFTDIVTAPARVIAERHWSKRSGFLGLGRTYYDKYVYRNLGPRGRLDRGRQPG